MKKTQLNTRETFDLSSLVSYVDGSTVSRILAKTGGGNITLFAFIPISIDTSTGLSTCFDRSR